MSEERPKESRGDAYYAALVEAWIATRMEKDRTLLSLSAGGVALVVTLLTTVGARSIGHLSLLLLATLAFLVAIAAGVRIFSLNAAHLQREASAFLSREPQVGEDAALLRLDGVLVSSFSAGVLISIVAALLSAWPPKESPMAESTPRRDAPTERSLSGVSNLRPEQPSGGQSSGQEQGGGAASTGQGQGTGAPPETTGEQ